MFVLGEKVVYAGHGVAHISRLIEKQIGGSITHFFELRFINKDMTILIPTNNLTTAGVRRLSSPENIDAIFKLLSQPAEPLQHELTTSNWNKRSKEYQCRLRTGKLSEIGKIYRDLRHISTQKELSFGEKSLLSQTEALLVEEIAIVGNIEIEKAIEQLRAQVGVCLPVRQSYTMSTL
jgi:CarD family transcriptional regulator